MSDIRIKSTIEVDTGNSEEKIAKTRDAMKGASAQTKEAGASFNKLKGELGALSPALGQASNGVGALTQAFNILKANPIIGVFALLAGLVVALFQKFKQMESVSDALGKAFGTLSGVFNTFLTGFLTPLIDGFVKLIENVSGGLIKVLTLLGVTTEKTANRFGELTESLDDLEDAQRNSAIATAEANRKLQDAREIAADANVPIKERIAALKEASRIEREESQKVIEINQTKARLTMEAMALELGARASLIAKIREGSIEQLKAARLELQSMKNVDKDKLTAIDQMIIAAENEAASMAKISKKTQSQISGIEKEEADKRKAIQEEKARKLKEAKEKEAKEEQDRIKAANKLLDDSEKRRLELNKEFEKNAKDKKDKEAKDEAEQIKINDDIVDASYQKEVKLGDEKINQDNRVTKAKEGNAELRAAQLEAEKDLAMGTLDTLSGLVDKNSVAGKSIAVATAVMNTYEGASKAIAQGGVFGPIAAAATIAAGLLNVKKIISTKIPSAKGGGNVGDGATPSLSASAPVLPIQMGTQLNQASIQGIGNAAAGGVNRSFILEADINNSNERQVRLQRAARLG